jgi:hypothetical protein
MRHPEDGPGVTSHRRRRRRADTASGAAAGAHRPIAYSRGYRAVTFRTVTETVPSAVHVRGEAEHDLVHEVAEEDREARRAEAWVPRERGR